MPQSQENNSEKPHNHGQRINTAKGIDKQPSDRDEISDLMLNICKLREEIYLSKDIKPIPRGTIVSIPYDHFNHCLHIVEGAPFNLRTFFELTAYLELGVLFDKLTIVPDTLKEIECFDNVGPASDLLRKEGVLIYLAGDDFTDTARFNRIFDNPPTTSTISSHVDYRAYFKNALAYRQLMQVMGSGITN